MEKTLQMPLAGVKVLELATVVAAPTAGRILATYGAAVIKVEPPAGDMLRMMASGHTLPAEPDNNPLFDVYNSGKKMVALNLKDPEGMAIFHQLLARSDIFISNVRMKSLEKMGLGYDALQEKYPKLIYAHFSGFGLTGPDMDRPGFDTTAFWLRSGAGQDWETPGAFPLRPSFAFGDITTADSFLTGILIALYARSSTGHGTLISTSLYQSGLWHSATAVLNSQYGKPYPADRYAPWNPFSDLYECADGEWIAVVEKDYDDGRPIVAKLFDLPEIMNDPRCASLAAMRESGMLQEISRKMERVMKTKPCAEWMQLLDAVDIPYERMRHYREVASDAQAAALGAYDYIDYPDGKRPALITPPIQFSDYGRRPTEQAGYIGADTDEVLHSLGYDDDRIAALHEGKAVR